MEGKVHRDSSWFGNAEVECRSSMLEHAEGLSFPLDSLFNLYSLRQLRDR
jgi:hypothetical protein